MLASRLFRFAAAAAAGTAAVLALPSATPARASSDCLAPPQYPWSHRGLLQSFDHASIRRGFQVYKQVCSTCHSVELLAFRNLVDVAYTEKEMKAIAAEYEVPDVPNDEGEIPMRPAVLSDKIPKPYPNEQAARFANNGALPPDLSLMIKAREHGADYVFALLTGYRDPPAGVEPRENMHFNPYFPGNFIGMARLLTDDLVEYDDGTPNTASQAARDVVTFLNWAAEPEHDDRKKMGMKVLFVLGCMAISTLWLKRFKWNVAKHRTITFLDMNRGPGTRK